MILSYTSLLLQMIEIQFYKNRSIMKSIIIGAGTYGEVYLSYLQEAGVEIVGFLDDNEELRGNTIRNIPLLGGIRLLES